MNFIKKLNLYIPKYAKFSTIVFFTLVLLACRQTTQSVDKGKERLDQVCDAFMKLFAENKTTPAFRLLKQNTVINPAEIDTLQLTVDKQMNNLAEVYGKIISYEFITERKIKDFFGRRFYILKFEKYFLKFEFSLYKASSGWTITNFKYSEEFNELL